MSRSEPSKTPEPERHYIGHDKPGVDISVQQPDPHSYARWKASRELGLPEWDLADEPDYNNRLDNIDEGT